MKINIKSVQAVMKHMATNMEALKIALEGYSEKIEQLNTHGKTLTYMDTIRTKLPEFLNRQDKKEEYEYKFYEKQITHANKVHNQLMELKTLVAKTNE